MSKIIENFLIPLFIIISIVYACNSFGSPIELNKVYHHTTNNKMYLERAAVSLYFSQDPQMQETTHSGSCSFFFPHVAINAQECHDMIKRINEYRNDYTVNITPINKGIQLVFNFDVHKCAISYERFDSIGLQKGIVFRLYNKDILQQLEQAHNKAVLRTLWHRGDKPCIAIDPGHGGDDCGAIGCNGVKEKDICLAISKEVGNLLQQRGCNVFLTRTQDCNVYLDERTFFANNKNADLFVSIHANYTTNNNVHGVETFCMQPHLLKKINSSMSDAQQICITDIMKQRSDCAYAYAQSVQQQICNAISSCYEQSVDRKVKHSVSQILLGAQMPAILIEVGFVSHSQESNLLIKPEYQNKIARGICDGILLNPMFFTQSPFHYTRGPS